MYYLCMYVYAMYHAMVRALDSLRYYMALSRSRAVLTFETARGHWLELFRCIYLLPRFRQVQRRFTCVYRVCTVCVRALSAGNETNRPLVILACDVPYPGGRSHGVHNTRSGLLGGLMEIQTLTRSTIIEDTIGYKIPLNINEVSNSPRTSEEKLCRTLFKWLQK